MPLIARPDDRTLVRVGRSTYKATVSHEVDAYWQQSARVQESRPDVQFRRFRCPRETELSVQQRPKYASVTPLLLNLGISDQRDRWFRYRDRGFRPIVTDSVVGSS